MDVDLKMIEIEQKYYNPDTDCYKTPELMIDEMKGFLHLNTNDYTYHKNVAFTRYGDEEICIVFAWIDKSGELSSYDLVIVRD